MKRIMFGLMLIVIVIPSIIFSASKGPAILKVTYNNIKISIDGATIPLKTEPFLTEDGEICCSIKEITNALGKESKYDAKTATLYIGKMPSGDWSYLSDMKPLNIGGSSIYFNPGETGKPIHIAGQEYIKCIAMYNSNSSSNQTSADFNLNANCTKFTGCIGLDDSLVGKQVAGDAFIYTDGVLVFSKTGIAPGDFPTDFNIDVSNVIKLSLKVKLRKASGNFYYSGLIIWGNPIITR